MQFHIILRLFIIIVFSSKRRDHGARFFFWVAARLPFNAMEGSLLLAPSH